MVHSVCVAFQLIQNGIGYVFEDENEFIVVSECVNEADNIFMFESFEHSDFSESSFVYLLVFHGLFELLDGDYLLCANEYGFIHYTISSI